MNGCCIVLGASANSNSKFKEYNKRNNLALCYETYLQDRHLGSVVSGFDKESIRILSNKLSPFTVG